MRQNALFDEKGLVEVEFFVRSENAQPMKTTSSARSAVLFFLGCILASQVTTEAQSFKALYSFPTSFPPGGFARPLYTGNCLYGPGGAGIFRINSDGTGYIIIKTFPPTVYNGTSANTNSDGATLLGGVIVDGDTLYGTASQGGLYGLGSLFSLKTNGLSFNAFKQFSGPDGKAPYGELLLVSNILYGTTAAGGDFGKGTVFQVNTDGSGFGVLHSFGGGDGLLPVGGLTLSGGVLYGTTVGGGSGSNGTVFSISLDGSGFTTVKNFSGADGASPRYHLVGSGGWIYGTADGGNSGGMVYELSTDGTQYNILKTFSPLDPVSGTNTDGYYTQSGLESCGGALFGSTRVGGYYGSGVLFALRMDGCGYTVLHHFTRTSNGTEFFINSDGAEPGPLTLYGGTLYGTPYKGGNAGAGALTALNIAPRIDVAGNGMGPSGFEFDVAGYSNEVVSVEACTDLAMSVWQSLWTNTIGVGPFHFADTVHDQGDSPGEPHCAERQRVRHREKATFQAFISWKIRTAVRTKTSKIVKLCR